MRPSVASVLPPACCGILMVLLSGCAHLDGQATDIDRLNDAIVRDDVDYVRATVKSGAVGINQPIAVSGYQEGTPLLTVAARSASLKVLRYLISAGADINARTPVNETALMLASFFLREDRERNTTSREPYDEAVRILVAAGAEIENYPYHYTPLSYAAYQGNDETVRFLIQHGARVDADAENGATYINTPLMMAAIQGHYGTALELLRAGASAAIRVHGGHTAAEFAEKYRHAELARLLHCAERATAAETLTQQCEGTMASSGTSPRQPIAR